MDEFVDSSGIADNPKRLRARAHKDGYLFVKGLMDPEQLAVVRREILQFCADAGWLEPGTDPAEGIAAQGQFFVHGDPEYAPIYDKIQMLESFHALAHTPSLLKLLDNLFGESTLVHPRNIARVIFPGAVQVTTPPHQDHIHIHGTEETWTAWMPLGDCPKELGSLAVLPGSHRLGVQPVVTAQGAGGVGIETESMPFKWAASDFEAGDVILFQSLLIHKGLPNVTPNRLRVSVDYRYQGVSQPIHPSSLQPHQRGGDPVEWDEYYKGWNSARFQYYWKDTPLNVVDKAVEWTYK